MNPPADTFANVSGLLLSLFVHGLFFVAPVLVFSYLAYFFLSLPAGRREQARLFLHVLETCVRDGKPVEPAIVAMAETHDRSPGLRFHLTAAYVEEGDRLATALAKSRLVPRPIIAMLAAGERIGDVRKVLPACRRQLQDARSGVRSALNLSRAGAGSGADCAEPDVDAVDCGAAEDEGNCARHHRRQHPGAVAEFSRAGAAHRRLD
jgi:hypothetical protein